MMEFHEKLQELRKQAGLTPEELAQALFVSRAAVSKWESGRGYPNIDSLKAIAKHFGVTVDELLSCDEILSLAQEDQKQKENRFRDLLFGLLDISTALLYFLPFFAHRTTGTVQAVSLLNLSDLAPYLKISFLSITAVMILWGILTLAFQGSCGKFRTAVRCRISALLNALGTLLFIIGSQPYGAAFLLVYLVIKMFMLIKRP